MKWVSVSVGKRQSIRLVSLANCYSPEVKLIDGFDPVVGMKAWERAVRGLGKKRFDVKLSESIVRRASSQKLSILALRGL